jgi:hypothetical protein
MGWRVRKYPLPKVVKTELENLSEMHPLVASMRSAAGATFSQLETATHLLPGTATAAWAERVVSNETDNKLKKLVGDDQRLPFLVMDSSESDDVAIGLSVGDRYFDGSDWFDEIPPESHLEKYDQDTVAFVAAALSDGADLVVLRQWTPLAFITAAGNQLDSPKDTTELPAKSLVVAIVDDIDKDAVLELVAIAPGPTLFRRHDGQWYDDPEWLQKVRAVVPPPMVQLEPGQIDGVVSQVDAATVGEPFKKEKKEKSEEGKSKPVRSSAGFTDEHWNRADEVAIRMALVAAKGNKVQGAKGAEQLRKYWLSGKGAAKIRWGTKGDWTRCVKQLTKYLGPRAKGYCNLMHARKLGMYPGQKKPPSAKVKAEAIAKQRGK